MSPAPRSLGDVAARFTRRGRGGTPAPRAPGTSGERVPGGVSVGEPRAARVEWGGAPAVQADATSCGAACLVMLAATGDDALARWLETGELPPGLGIDEVPPEIPVWALGAGLTAAQRFAVAQKAMRNRTASHALGPFPWPRSLGTTPWTAARAARFPGVRYTSRPVDDRADAGVEMLGLLLTALDEGTPVLLYTGGNRHTGLVTAVPRHVVLAVPNAEGRTTGDGDPLIPIYEPHSGFVFEVPATELTDRTAPCRALGHWTHVQWLVLPRGIRTSGD